MQNIECKFELRDMALARTVLRGLRATPTAHVRQVDTYYKLADGRMKRRETWDLGALVDEERREFAADPKVEFVVYHRENQARARSSQYLIYTVEEAAVMFGATLPPEWVRVTKVREVWMASGVRVHLDVVEGVGHFLEFEAVVSAAQNMVRCYEAVHRLQEALAGAIGGAMSDSYSDMVVRGAGEPTASGDVV
ncbi:hypothetical protein BH11PLA1_BH11PLA1_17350 [soil metagenome]